MGRRHGTVAGEGRVRGEEAETADVREEGHTGPGEVAADLIVVLGGDGEVSELHSRGLDLPEDDYEISGAVVEGEIRKVGAPGGPALARVDANLEREVAGAQGRSEEPLDGRMVRRLGGAE